MMCFLHLLITAMLCLPFQVHPDDLDVYFPELGNTYAYCVRSCRSKTLIPSESVIVEVNGISTVISTARNHAQIVNLFERGGTSMLKLCFVPGPVIDFQNRRWPDAWNALRTNIRNRVDFRRTGSNAFNNSYRFAQVNTFFVLDFPTDSVVHGLAMASVTAREHFNVKVIRDADWRMYTHHEDEVLEFQRTPNDPNYLTHVATEHSFSNSIYFIPLTRLVPTPILVLPWYVENFDIINMSGELKWPSRNEPLPYKLLQEKVKSKKKRRYATCNKEDISHLSLIDMYPARRKLTYCK